MRGPNSSKTCMRKTKAMQRLSAIWISNTAGLQHHTLRHPHASTRACSYTGRLKGTTASGSCSNGIHRQRSNSRCGVSRLISDSCPSNET